MNESPRAKLYHRAELIGCILASLIAIHFHFRYLHHAGPLWRDEAGGAGLAGMSTFREFWTLLNVDSFPLGLPLAMRVWAHFFSDTDASFRVLGFIIGLFFLVALWLTGRFFGRRVPTIAIALLAVNLTVIWWGDSLRAYGMACAFLLLTFGSMWALVQKPGAKNFLLTATFAVLSVQSLFQNAFLIMAVCSGAWVICWLRRQMRPVVFVAGVAVVAALSLVPYVPGVRASQKWWVLQKSGFNLEWVWGHFYSAMAASYDWQGIVWLALWLCALVFGARALLRRNQPVDELKVYAVVTLVAAMILFTAFVWLSGLPTQSWYYLSITTLAAVCADVLLATAWPKMPAWRLVVLAIMVLIPLQQSDEVLHCRQSNADIVAKKLEALAAPEDLILLHPWYFGGPFERHYHGKTPWTTLPPLADYRLQRFDLVREQIMQENPTAPVMAQIARTMEAGHNIWLVGWFNIPASSPPSLPPAPNGPKGWLENEYSFTWADQAAYFVAVNSPEAPQIIAETECIRGIENLLIYRFAGKVSATNTNAP